MIDEEKIRLPHGFLQRKTTEIPFGAIRSVTAKDLMGTTVIILQSDKGKFEIPSALIQDPEDFAEVLSLLESKTEPGRGE